MNEGLLKGITSTELSTELSSGHRLLLYRDKHITEHVQGDYDVLLTLIWFVPMSARFWTEMAYQIGKMSELTNLSQQNLVSKHLYVHNYLYEDSLNLDPESRVVCET